MEKKEIQKIKARVQKANRSFSVMGDMLLCLQIDGMTHEQRLALQAGMLEGRTQVRYKYLDEKLAKGAV